jgi:hypothetical protein
MAIDNPIASGGGPRPQFDEQIPNGTGVISAIMQCRQESEQARLSRLTRNDMNWDVYMGRQDWRHKQEGQSKEFLPKVPVSVEQMGALIKRGLIQFGDYFSVSVDSDIQQLISGSQIRTLLKCFLEDLWGPNNTSNTFPLVISDGVKQALLKSLIILKVHGGNYKRRTFRFEKGSAELGMEEAANSSPLIMEEEDQWKLRIDLLRFEDYYPDPSGMDLYEIHRCERDLHEVLEMAEVGVYDKTAVNQLIGSSHERPEDEELSEEDRGHDISVKPSFRKKVLIDEFWGTLLDDNGEVAHRNVVATIANEKFLIRPPEPNPFWHQESPFVVRPLIRVPHSVWHKALYDHGSDLNLAINELFNLMLDGGMAAVWGIKQLRIEDLEDPRQVEAGIRQGQTLAVKQTLPNNAKVLETVSEGDVPRDAMAVFDFLNKEYHTAVMSNELNVGALPPKQVLATEVLQSSQSQNLMLDGIIADLEVLISDTLRKSWLNILQNADDIPKEAFPTMADRRVAMLLMQASPEERFALFAGKCKMKVFGLSGTLTRALDFQKIMAMLQAVTVNPMLFQAFLRRFSPDRTLDQMMVTLNISPEKLEKTPEELEQADAEMQRTMGAAQMLGQGPQSAEGGPAGVAAGQGTGGSPETAGIQQAANPMSGMAPNG